MIKTDIYLCINNWLKPRMLREIRNGHSRVIYDATRKDSFKMKIYRKLSHLNYVIFADKDD